MGLTQQRTPFSVYRISGIGQGWHRFFDKLISTIKRRATRAMALPFSIFNYYRNIFYHTEITLYYPISPINAFSKPGIHLDGTPLIRHSLVMVQIRVASKVPCHIDLAWHFSDGTGLMAARAIWQRIRSTLTTVLGMRTPPRPPPA